jgi:isopenicillin N synthase-like dioxygenase
MSSPVSLVQAAQAAEADPSFQHIPIVDLKHLLSSEPDVRRKLADQIRDACLNVGFLYVKNHGIHEELTQDALQASKQFFSLPLETKMELDNRTTPNFKGYSALLSGNNDPENSGDLQEGFEFGREELDPKHNAHIGVNDGVMAGANVWPSDLPGFRLAVLKYYHAAVNLGKLLFPLFALALYLPEDFFDDKTGNSAAMMRVLHYPPQTGPVDGRVIGIGAHTDWECFTILWQEPGIQALQVLNADKQWINAPPIPGALVINLGDEFARWTNDIFKSTVHRAINRSGVRRYSIPLFFGTDYDVELQPIPSCVSPERPAKYEVITSGEYVKSKLKATYGH